MTELDENFERARARAALVEGARAIWQQRFGEGSVSALAATYESALRLSVASDPFELEALAPSLLERVEREHCARYGAAALGSELFDQRERAAAATDDATLVRYDAKWRRRLLRIQLAHPERWRVPGLSADEVRDLLTLRLIEAVRGEPEAFSRTARAGREGTFECLKRELSLLRQSFRLEAVPADPCEFRVCDSTQTQEEQCLEHEASWARQLARTRAEHALSRPQKKWLSALEATATAGDFYRASAEPNLSAASRLLGKNRSSALRAYRELQARFARELKRIG